MTNPTAPIASSPRVIRVFVSSTFRDMQAERDELVKRIFPQLRKLCETRGVTWGEVDLRWGLTDEQKAEGKVLPICLAEIHNCRPYFIGLLGERYGWVPDEVMPGLVEQEEWLGDFRDRSVTELEILHGVLNNPGMGQHAFFYFRDASYTNSLPLEQRQPFLEIASPEESQQLGIEEASRRAEERARKLVLLKERIRESGFPVREGYPDPRSLGRLVLEDLTRLIDTLFPKGSAPDPLDREATEHEAFARSRARVYIGRREYVDQLEEHVRADSPPLVVLGDSGSGKSALLANWAFRYREASSQPLPRTRKPLWRLLTDSLRLTSARKSESNLLMHFIGATPHSADCSAMLRRIMGEFKRRFDIRVEIPEQPDALRADFPNWLQMAAAKGRVVLILDALNQLEDRDGAPDLVWLPAVLPSNIRLIVSTLPGRSLDELTRRGWPTLRVGPLEPQERKQLVADYLAQFRKTLSTLHVERIAGAPQTANPLYLRALLDELRIHGEHFTLSQRIEHYVTATTVAELYEKILERYEQDYERERPKLVRDTMKLLWAARRGLSESELMILLGDTQGPLPRAHWSPLYLAAEPSLVSRSGLVGFGHDYLRQAVRGRYLPIEQEQQDAHRLLADYFEAQDLSPRKLDELPWQLSKAQFWQRLSDLLSDRQFLAAAWNADEFEVKSYWARIEASSPLRIADAYRSALDAPAEDSAFASLVAAVLSDTGHPDEALSIRSSLVDTFAESGDFHLPGSMGALALSLAARGELDQAMRLHKEEEQLYRLAGDDRGLQRTLGNQAIILFTRGEIDEAMRLFKEKERLCRQLGDKEALQRSLGNQANILQTRGELDEAMRLHKEQERLCRELGNREGLQRGLGNQSGIFIERGELDEAMRLLKEEEQICREVGNKESLSVCLGNQANIFHSRGELDEAMRLHQEEERLCRELSKKDGLANSLHNQANSFYSRGDLDEALRLYSESERIYRELGNKAGLALCLGNRAALLQDRGEVDDAAWLLEEQKRIHRELGTTARLRPGPGEQASIATPQTDIAIPQTDLDRAMSMHQEEERACREADNMNGLQLALGRQAIILYRRGELDESMRLNKEKERICRELGNNEGLAVSLGEQALILKRKGDLDEAMRLHREEERICREIGSSDGLSRTLNNQAGILLARGDLDEAMRLLKEQEQICRELDNKDGLGNSLGNQGAVFHLRGELDEAMRLYKEEERLCRELSKKEGLANSLGNQATILRDKGEVDEAMRLRREEQFIWRQFGNNDGLARSLINHACLLAGDLADFRQALPLAEEAYRVATAHNLTALVPQIEPILEAVRSRVR